MKGANMTKRRAAYYSWNATEQARLLDATHDEIVLYLTILKPLADFRTGIVGTFAPKQPLSFTRLGALLSRPKTQGRAAVAYDGTQAKRVLEQLAARGLVCEIVQVGGVRGALILRLPLSPIGATDSKGKLSGEPPGQSAENPTTAGGFGEPHPPSTVLTNTDLTHQSQRDNSIDQPPPIPEVESGAEPAPVIDVSDDEFMPFDETPPRLPRRQALSL